ncbi:MAG: right-handed parallel beta-helix repeat-containing protein [Chamaesiphon sp.]|nr:right-handed parallel beta-helix repeat-containing protein [Chamaesiphon sp.]
MKNTLFSRLLLSSLCLGWYSQPSLAQAPSYLQLTVNSDRDEIRPDGFLTLREAISIVNGTLPLDRLSPEERQLVSPSTDRHQVQFKLTLGKSRIGLNAELPAIVTPKVTIDGGAVPSNVSIQNLRFARPVVEIVPAPDAQINRGLSLMADDLTVKGLSIYGFQVGNTPATQNIPGADIFIGTSNYPQLDTRTAPQRILIENNWLGIQSDRAIPDRTSDFGVYVFNSDGTTIRHNAIAHHSASGIISQVSANNLLVTNNAIFANGQSGMPDAIRLEGKIANSQIQANLICGNDGSGIFVFKPESGSVKITNNRIQSNGRRLRRAAIHLMGEDNQVTNNAIEFQSGAGVSVTAFPHNNTTSSLRNLITGNRFQQIEGLSIDLIADRNQGVEDFQTGDGINPPRNSENRRIDTGNGAINAPQFLSKEFYLIDNHVNLDGIADPGSEVEIYQVNPDGNNYGPLSTPLTKVIANDRGQFQATFQNLMAGNSLSAIASDPRYGSSEPAENAIVSLPGVPNKLTTTTVIPGNCALTEPKIAASPVAEPAIVPEKVTITIPRNVHFALDKSYLSPASTKVLDQIITVLQANPYLSFDLSGHTDPRAPQAYNQALGMRRAISVRNYLLKRGIEPQRMTIRSEGFSKRRSNQTGKQPYALDRRVEFEYRDLRGSELEVIDKLDDLQLER